MRSGHEGESGSSGLQLPNVTDHDQEEYEGATALDISSASSERDSPDCSTSAHHIYTKVSSTPSSRCDSTLGQNRQVSERTLCCNSF
jgi:hypothetical protein